MQALAYWKAVATDDAGFLEQIVSLLESNGITWCVIGGQGVNAWVEPLVSLDDILQGKIWAAEDPDRRPSKRLKDITDIARLIEKYPELRTRVPSDILERIRF